MYNQFSSLEKPILQNSGNENTSNIRLINKNRISAIFKSSSSATLTENMKLSMGKRRITADLCDHCLNLFTFIPIRIRFCFHT
jgi:hypothetical protein